MSRALNGHGQPALNGPLAPSHPSYSSDGELKLTCAVDLWPLYVVFALFAQPCQYRGTIGSPSAGAVAVVHVLPHA